MPTIYLRSVVGRALLLVYALDRRDPIFIARQGFGLVTYLRNDYFIILNSKPVDLLARDSGGMDAAPL